MSKQEITNKRIAEKRNKIMNFLLSAKWTPKLGNSEYRSIFYSMDKQYFILLSKQAIELYDYTRSNGGTKVASFLIDRTKIIGDDIVSDIASFSLKPTLFF